jgi:hypothetical protein
MHLASLQGRLSDEIFSNVGGKPPEQKSDAGQLGQAVSWFSSKYPAAAGVPVIVHPHRHFGPGATAE